MGRECPNHIEEFDSFFSTRQLKLMKLFLPYIAPALRRKLMVYIKYQEWQITARYLSRPLLFSEVQENPANVFLSEKTEAFSPGKFCSLIEPYLGEKDCSHLRQLKEMLENMDMLQQMQEMMGSMEDMDMDSLNSMFQVFEKMDDQNPHR